LSEPFWKSVTVSAPSPSSNAKTSLPLPPASGQAKMKSPSSIAAILATFSSPKLPLPSAGAHAFGAHAGPCSPNRVFRRLLVLSVAGQGRIVTGGENGFDALEAELRLWNAPPRFWWRDDDTRQVSPDFLRMLEWAERLELPGLLSVIPGRLEPEVPEALAPFSRLKVAQHGWMHENHAPDGVHKSEFGEERPKEKILHDLACGFSRMQERFPSRFLPVLVPPFNDVGSQHLPLLEGVGFTGISIDYRVTLPRHTLSRADIHVELQDGLRRWAPPRQIVPHLIPRMCRILEGMRREGSNRPFGFLTHHGDIFTDKTWWVFARIVEVTRHWGCEWADPGSVFEIAEGDRAVSGPTGKLVRSAAAFFRRAPRPSG
jgi:hypothetical protein